MSAHSPRRSFAVPFVITLVAAPACSTATPTPPSPAAAPADPTPPAQPTPPAEPAEPAAPVELAAPVDPGKPVRWRVTQVGDECFTQLRSDCDASSDRKKCPPGPAKVKYACPKYDDGSPLSLGPDVTIDGHVGGDDCELDRPDPPCPPPNRCNPPPPPRVECPKR